jgi:hypothetical protein
VFPSCCVIECRLKTVVSAFFYTDQWIGVPGIASQISAKSVKLFSSEDVVAVAC